MNVKSLVKNAAIAFLAQGITLLISCITSLLVPKLLGVEEYGYWQLFVFYAGYVGFFHFGLNDGVYLLHGGESRDQIDKRSINSQFLVGSIFQLILCVATIVAVVRADFGPQRGFILICTSYYMVVKNASAYLGYTFQAMNETKLYSFSCILERMVFLMPLVGLLLIGAQDFTGFVIAYCASGTVQLFFCLWFARDFLMSGLNSPKGSIEESLGSVRVGIKLMFANIASQLILGVARFVIDAVWGIKTFGELSLALSLVNFVLAFASQAAMVLFPALRQENDENTGKFFHMAQTLMGLTFPAVFLFYFPGVWLLSMWLPQYANSFIFFAYLLPVCVFDGKMNIACATCFKVTRQETLLLKINVCTTCFSTLGAVLGGFAFNSIWVVVATAVIAVVARSVISEMILSGRLGVGGVPTITYGELIVTLIFVVVASLLVNYALAFVVYALIYGAYLALNRNCCKEVFGEMARALSRC